MEKVQLVAEMSQWEAWIAWAEGRLRELARELQSARSGANGSSWVCGIGGLLTFTMVLAIVGLPMAILGFIGIFVWSDKASKIQDEIRQLEAKLINGRSRLGALRAQLAAL
jgi:hypothetical protein